MKQYTKTLLTFATVFFVVLFALLSYQVFSGQEYISEARDIHDQQERQRLEEWYGETFARALESGTVSVCDELPDKYVAVFSRDTDGHIRYLPQTSGGKEYAHYTEANLYEDCSLAFAVTNRDPGICDQQFDTTPLRDSCFLRVAEEMAVFSEGHIGALCDKIQDRFDRESCERYIDLYGDSPQETSGALEFRLPQWY